jgi:hypothetical protein
MYTCLFNHVIIFHRDVTTREKCQPVSHKMVQELSGKYTYTSGLLFLYSSAVCWADTCAVHFFIQQLRYPLREVVDIHQMQHRNLHACSIAQQNENTYHTDVSHDISYWLITCNSRKHNTKHACSVQDQQKLEMLLAIDRVVCLGNTNWRYECIVNGLDIKERQEPNQPIRVSMKDDTITANT